MNSKVTIFQSLNEISTPFYPDILEVLDRIKTGKKSKEIVTQIRLNKNSKDAETLKKSMPVICFSAHLYKIAEDSINNHTGFICIDFDDYKSDKELVSAKKTLSDDEHVFAIFKSVSANGLKVVIKIPPSIENHAKSFQSLKEYFSDPHFNESGYNVSMVCYESYDPEIYINPDSTTWEDLSDHVMIMKEDELVDNPSSPDPIVKEERKYDYPEYRKFWKLNDKGVINLNHYAFKIFLVDNGFYKYFPGGSKNYIFVRRVSNRVANTLDHYIKDFVLRYIDEHVGEEKVWNFFADKTRFFKEDFLSFLPEIKIKFMKDTPELSYLFFKNVAVEVSKDNVTEINYEDLNGWVWEDQMIDRDYKRSNTDDCDFKRFVHNVSGDETDRIKSIESTIGFLLHGYKDPKYCPAVILNDELISNNPEGGTGKGLIAQAISQIRKMVVIDGKKFNPNSSFPYQTVQQDTQVLTFDDVKANFQFESLFSVITEGITLEKKNKDAIKIDFKDSPKILLNTNYAIKGSGNSFERRKWELELKQFYSMKFTPFDDFGRRLFEDWDDEEWSRYYTYMIGNLQAFLRTGFVHSKLGNLKTRKFISETSIEFYEWMSQDNLQFNNPGVKIFLYNAMSSFVLENPDYDRFGRLNISHQRFGQWMEKYAIYKFNEPATCNRTSEGKWIMFNQKKEEPAQKKMNLV